MFVSQPTIEIVKLSNGQEAYVIDDFCIQPALWLQLAIDNEALFRDAGSLDKVGYPGIELVMPDLINQSLTEFFMQHIRRLTHSRRLIYSVSRLSLVNLQPAELSPAQCICHRDIARVSGGVMTASVLYLFDDPLLGGTSFYSPKKPPEQISQLVDDSLRLSADQFFQQYGVVQNYMLEANDWFEKIGSVPAKKNRIVFYSGDIFHSADITEPSRMSADPRVGRLTLNGFFYFSPSASHM